MAKTKISNLIMCVALCIVLCVSVVAGCSLVTKDMAKYYNAVVASFQFESGEKINVTKKELITSFNSFGYNYVQSYGMSVSEAYKMTLEKIIDKKLTIRAAENKLKAENNGQILTEKEQTYLWEKTYEAVEDNIISYYKEINNIKDDENTEDTADGVVAEKNYESSATLVSLPDGGYEIRLNKTTKSEVDNHVFWNGADRNINNQSDLDVMFDYVTTFVRETPIYSQGYNKYLSDAKKSEEGMHLSVDNKSVMQREFKRIYDALYESFMVTKYSEANQTSNSAVTIDNILKLYKSQVLNDYNKYVTENASGYEEAVLSDISKVKYFKTSGTEFFYVSHLLAKFSDEDMATIEECQKCIDGTSTKYTAEEAQTIIDGLYNNLSFVVRERNEKGEWIEAKNEDGSVKTKPVMAVLEEVKTKLATAGDNETLKAEYFNELIYKYNQDEGVFNSEYDYVIGVDYSTPDSEKGTVYTAHSKMVEPFTNAAIELYDHGNVKVGDVYDGVIKTEFGIHLMVFEGKVENLFEGIDGSFNLRTSDIERLAQARIKQGEKKTVFDSLFDTLNNDGFAVFENMNLQFLRSEGKITFYPDNYKDLI